MLCECTFAVLNVYRLLGLTTLLSMCLYITYEFNYLRYTLHLPSTHVSISFASLRNHQMKSFRSILVDSVNDKCAKYVLKDNCMLQHKVLNDFVSYTS